MPKNAKQNVGSVVSDIRARIKQLQQKGKKIGEQDTKRALINPMLDILGWDLEDLDEVRNEYRYKSKSNPVDYALFVMGDPILFVEAKPLNTTLEDHKWISQTLSYTVEAGVEWCVLTNGDEYRLYNAHALVDAEGKLFRSVRVSEQADHDLTVETLGMLSKDKMSEKLLSILWKSHFIDRSVKLALEDLFHNQDDSLVRLVKKKTDGLTSGDIANSLKRANFHLDFPVLDIPNGDEKKENKGDAKKPKVKKGEITTYNVSLSDLINAGLITPPLEIEKVHKKKHHTAIIEKDGTVTFNKENYPSLSTAGGYARVISSGPPPDGRNIYQTNGWTFWKYRNPETGKLEPIDELRQIFLKMK